MRIRRPSGAFLASLVVHGILVAVFVQALLMERPLLDIFSRVPVPDGIVERLHYMELPSGGSRERTVTPPPIAPPARPAAPPPVVTPPREVPREIPPPPAERPGRRTDSEPSTGPLTGGNGNLRGVQPRFTDERIWAPPGAIVRPPKEGIELLDSVTVAEIERYYDSLRTTQAGRREPGDWTVERGGRKYGIDQKFIRLGPISIPTAVLALLPLNVTGNPTMTERERQYNNMHAEIMSNAQRSQDQADFNKAVRALRERRDRERREQEARERAANAGTGTPTETQKKAEPSSQAKSPQE